MTFLNLFNIIGDIIVCLTNAAEHIAFLFSGLIVIRFIFLSFIIAYRKMGLRTLPPYFAIVVILFLSFLNEDTIETLAGSVLFTLIPCLLAKHFSIFQDINDQ